MIAGLALMPMVAVAQTAEQAGPRTPWGHPDLQGIWLVVDPSNGRLPALTEPARRRANSPEAARIEGVRRGRLPAATYEDLDAGDRCIQHAKAGPRTSHWSSGSRSWIRTA